MKQLVQFIFVCAFFIVGAANAQNETLKLWPNGVPGSKVCPDYLEQNDGSCVKQVSDPELLVFLPSPEKSCGSAVLILPGGGYNAVAYQHEGIALARWFNEKGIAGIVLKYRLPSDKIMQNKSIGPLQDAQHALRIIRSKSTAWHIDPNKVGVMGFSAGGHLASMLSTHYDAKIYDAPAISARPDFSILIYPLISFDWSITHRDSRENLLGLNPDSATVAYYSANTQVNSNTPPAFLIHSADDDCVPVKNSLLYFEALNRNKVPVEMNIYQKSGHGFGMGIHANSTVSTWTSSCLVWLKMNGWAK